MDIQLKIKLDIDEMLECYNKIILEVAFTAKPNQKIVFKRVNWQF